MRCLAHALGRFWRDGGYLIVRRSHWGWFPHFLWAADLRGLEVEQFKPEAPRQRWLPPLCPRGRIVVGPDELEQP